MARQQTEVVNLEYDVELASEGVVSSLDGRSLAAARRLHAAVRKAAQAIDRACAQRPARLARLVERSGSLSGTRLGHRGLLALIADFGSWGATVDRAGVARRRLANHAGCRRMARSTSVSYAVRWRPEPGGRDYWVELTMDNRTATDLTGQTRGRLRVSNARGFSRGDRVPGAGPFVHRWEWGGSSADTFGAAALSEETSLVGVGPLGHLHVRPNGGVHHVRPEAHIHLPGGPGDCSLPVRRAR